KGSGEFDVKVYSGGLPGAGWDGKTVMKGTAKRDGDAVVATGKDVADREFSARIAEGQLSLKTEAGAGTLKKVERKSDTLGKKPPEGAVVLYGTEGDETNWTNGKLME